VNRLLKVEEVSKRRLILRYLTFTMAMMTIDKENTTETITICSSLSQVISSKSLLITLKIIMLSKTNRLEISSNFMISKARVIYTSTKIF